MPDHTNSHVADHAAELLPITGAADLLRAPVATLRYWRHCNTGPRSFASAAASSTAATTSTPGSTRRTTRTTQPGRDLRP
jgi:hypothetical protein